MPTYGTTMSSTSPFQLTLGFATELDAARTQRLAQLLLAPSTGGNGDDSPAAARASTWKWRSDQEQVPVNTYWHVAENVNQLGQPEYTVRWMDWSKQRWLSKTFDDKRTAERFARKVQG